MNDYLYGHVRISGGKPTKAVKNSFSLFTSQIHCALVPPFSLMRELHQPIHQSNERVPSALQGVFLASNRGQDVHLAPPNRVAFKMFSWFRHGRDPNMKRSGLKPKTSVSKPTKKAMLPTGSPQTYLDSIILSRGYSTTRFETLKTAYYNKATALQLTSASAHLTELVQNQDSDAIDDLLSAGLSPNPCNNNGESLVHLVCRQGSHKILQVMLDHGCSVQIADDYGRTPLHDACTSATPPFEVVDLLLQQDVRLLHMQDFRGFVPLLYARPEHWNDWIGFFESRQDTYWPRRDGSHPQEPPSLTLEGPNTRPIPDPIGALSLQLAGMVASGQMKPEEAEFLRYDTRDALNTSTGTLPCSADTSEYDISETHTSEHASESYDDELFNEDELADILSYLDGKKCPIQEPLRW